MFARLVIAAALFLPITASGVMAKDTHTRTTATTQSRVLQSARADASSYTGPSGPQAVYDHDGYYLGADPDPFIRLQLLRDNQPARAGK